MIFGANWTRSINRHKSAISSITPTRIPTELKIPFVESLRSLYLNSAENFSDALVLEARRNLNNFLNPLLREHVLPMNNFPVLSPTVASFNNLQPPASRPKEFFRRWLAQNDIFEKFRIFALIPENSTVECRTCELKWIARVGGNCCINNDCVRERLLKSECDEIIINDSTSETRLWSRNCRRIRWRAAF